MEFVMEDIFKIILAVVIGGLIGAEREYRHRAAGFRTIIFICVGSTLFTMLSHKLGGQTSPVRIAAHTVTGVGFLCAGVVMERGKSIVGLTTASAIWLTAALGMGIGGGEYILIVVIFVAMFVVLTGFTQFEEWLVSVRDRRTYEMVAAINPDQLRNFEDTFRKCGLQVKGHKMIKEDGKMVCIVDSYGSPSCHEKLMQELMRSNEVLEFHY